MIHEITLSRYCAGVKGPLYLGTWDSYGTEALHVALGEGWEGLTVSATFISNGIGTKILVDGEGYAIVPPEATAAPALGGQIVFEGLADGVRRISANLPYWVEEHASARGQAAPPSQSEWEQFVSQVGEDRRAAHSAREEAVQSAAAARASVESAQEAESETRQAFSEFLTMLGTDVATLVEGKLPAEQIPAIATTEIAVASSQAEMEGLASQRGDICIRSDENKSYIRTNDGWVYLASPTDYASRAGHADTAANAENAARINGHRLVEMSAGEFAQAVKDDGTYYIVWSE